MLNSTSADAPQSVVPPIQTDGALPEEAGTYLKADSLKARIVRPAYAVSYHRPICSLR